MTAGQPDPLRARDGHGRYVRTLAGVERDAEATRQRGRGRTFQQISDDLGYGSKQAAHEAVKRVMSEIEEPAREEARKSMLEHLDELRAEALKVLDAAHVTVSQGRIVVDGEGKPLPDDAPVLAAIDRLLRIEDRRAKLLGLDAPAKLDVTQSGRLDAAVAELEAELRARAGSDEVPAE